jgi:hypothetical protein
MFLLRPGLLCMMAFVSHVLRRDGLVTQGELGEAR